MTERVSRRQALLTALLTPIAARVPSFSGLSSETFDLPTSAPRAIPMYTQMISLSVTDEMIEDWEPVWDRMGQREIELANARKEELTGIRFDSQKWRDFLASLPPRPPKPVLDGDPYHRYLRDGEPWPDEWEDDEW